jgi:hypothetical protein
MALLLPRSARSQRQRPVRLAHRQACVQCGATDQQRTQCDRYCSKKKRPCAPCAVHSAPRVGVSSVLQVSSKAVAVARASAQRSMIVPSGCCLSTEVVVTAAECLRHMQGGCPPGGWAQPEVRCSVTVRSVLGAKSVGLAARRGLRAACQRQGKPGVTWLRSHPAGPSDMTVGGDAVRRLCARRARGPRMRARTPHRRGRCGRGSMAGAARRMLDCAAAP